MKQDILKIAGVKSEKELYAKYGTEAEFMAKHGGAFKKAVKKAKMGTAMVKKQLTQLTDFANPPQAKYGLTEYSYDDYVDPVSAEDEYIANMDAMNVAQSPMKQFPINVAGKSAKVKTPLESKDNIFGGVRNIIQGGIQMKDDRQKYLRAKQWGKIADLSQKARKDDVVKNKYFRPEDMVFDPNQLSRSYGTGYGIIGSAQDGMQIGGNETPIHNMYTNDDTLYSDLGYEPLEESVKQYQDGGGLFSNWKGDLTKFGSQNATTLGGSAGSFIGGGDGRTSGTSTMLGGVGQLAGTAIGGPLGGVIGSLAGSALGGLFSAGQERRMQEQQDKLSTLGGMQNIYNFQGRNSGFMEDGGEVGLKYLSHDWQPQTITKFGEYDVKDLLRDDPTMDTLRYGGTMHHPKNPSQRALQTYDMGGELEVDDRGDIDYEGYNPITAASGANGYIGITRGPSHDNGGFNLSYGGNEIEAEGNETIMEKADDGASINPETGQPESNLIILGDMKTLDNGQFIGQNANKETLKKITKGKNIKDMKFKHAGNNIAKLTGSLNKKEDKYLEMLDDDDPLKNASATAALKGIDMQYQDLNNIQNNLMNLQESYHSAAKQYGYDDTPEFLKDLKKGSLSGNIAKFGAKMETAQGGIRLYGEDFAERSPYGPGRGYQFPSQPAADSKKASDRRDAVEVSDFSKVTDEDLKQMYAKAYEQKRGKAVTDFQRAFHAKYPELAKSIIGEEKYGTTSYGKSRNLTKADLASNEDAIFGPRTERYMASISGSKRVPGPVIGGNKTAPTPPNITAKVPEMSTVKAVTPPPKDGMKFSDIYNMFSQYTRPYIKNPLDPRQLAGEMYGLASNQLEGVKAQGYQPYLETPYSVSFQDQMNANQSDFNAMQRQLGGDPASLSTLAAQKYAANSGVLGQQFRANQEMQMGAYNRNRATLNDAAIKNLAIYDQQADKQSRARSITKAQDYEYLRSIGDKFARARAEELAANVQANMYPDYTFGPKGRIYNTGIANFDIPQNISSDPEFAKMYSDYLNKKETKTKDTKVKNGGIVKAYKNL